MERERERHTHTHTQTHTDTTHTNTQDGNSPHQDSNLETSELLPDSGVQSGVSGGKVGLNNLGVDFGVELGDFSLLLLKALRGKE